MAFRDLLTLHVLAALCAFSGAGSSAVAARLTTSNELPTVQAADELLSAASHDHLWFALPTAQSRPATTSATKPADESARGYDLYHHASDLGGPYYKVQNWLARKPVAMASWNNRVWVAFPPKLNALEPRFEVHTIEVEKSPALDVYLSLPSGRMDIVEPLPADLVLASFVGTAEGPVALMLPMRHEQQPRLLRLQYGRWNALEFPADFEGRRNSRLAVGGQNGAHLTLLAPQTQEPGRTLRYDRQPDGQWRRSELAFDLSHLRAIVNVGGKTVIALANASNEIELSYLRPAGLAALSSFPLPNSDWSLLGFADGLRIIARSPEGAIQIQTIGSLSGDVSRPQSLVSQPLTTGKLWQVSMLVAISISGLLLVFLIKPVSKAPVTLPTGTVPLPASMRVGALLLDLLPAGIIVGLVLRSSLRELLNVPVLTIDLEQSVPFLLMAGLAMFHSTLTELFTGGSRGGVSLGKAIMGARVVSVSGQRPKPHQIILRNLLKCLILIVPPLAVFALINPHLQGLSDIAAGTVVVHEPEQAPEERAEDP